MFQFRAFPSYAYLIQRTIPRYCLRGFPHSEISGSTDICSSPKLIAACHVLLRLLMPRHSPCALISLTISSGSQKELCRSQKFLISRSNCSFTHNSTKKSVRSAFRRSTLCCLAYYLIIFHCSVFKVQAEDTFSCTL